jgi:integrase
MRELRTAHISQMIRDLSGDNADGDRNLGTTTLRRIHACLRSALTDAVKDGLVQHNAAVHATVPRPSRHKVNPWQPEELGSFLDYAASDRFGPVFELLAMAGLRRGEVLGLRWA